MLTDMAIRVVVADDSYLIREAVTQLLEWRDDIELVASCEDLPSLLEAIVFPNASFARGFEPVQVTTTAGEAVAGVLKSEGETIVIGLADGQERRIPRAEVADLQPGSVSLMPAGFGDQLSRQELADLLAFLKGTRWGA